MIDILVTGAPYVLFCAWCILFPASVRRFYTWMNPEGVRARGFPKDTVIRLVGLAFFGFFILMMSRGKR
jgi:hypothetical protein